MTPLAEIKEGILNKDWTKVISGYTKITGETLVAPESRRSVDENDGNLQKMYEDYMSKNGHSLPTIVVNEVDSMTPPRMKKDENKKAPIKEQVKKRRKNQKTKFITEP